MKKVAAIAIILAVVMGVSGAFAQEDTNGTGLRFDLGLDVLGGFGVVTQTFGGSSFDSTFNNVLNSIVVPFPEFGASYQFDLGILKLGAGVRIFSLILVSLGFPNVYVDMDIGDFNIQAQIGGLYFFAFGIVPFTSTTGPFMIPDLSVNYKFSDGFKVGLGAASIVHRDYIETQEVFPIVWYVNVKFSFY